MIYKIVVIADTICCAFPGLTNFLIIRSASKADNPKTIRTSMYAIPQPSLLEISEKSCKVKPIQLIK